MAFFECGINECSQSTYKTVRMVACRTDVLVPVCKYHYDIYYNEVELDSSIEESTENIFNELYLERLKDLFQKERFLE